MTKFKFNIERKTKLVLGVLYLILVALVVIYLWGIKDTTSYLIPTITLGIGIILLIEAGVTQFFIKSTYKKITAKEIFNGITAITGAGIITLSFALFGLLPSGITKTIIDLFASSAGVVALVGGVLTFIHFFISKN